MRFLFLGDIVGRPGRNAVDAHLPTLRERLKLDFVVANGENSAGGFGITEKIVLQLKAAGVDVITTGNHVWDQPGTHKLADNEPILLRPSNYPELTPGRGAGLFVNDAGQKLFVLNVMGKLFMEPLDDPFESVTEILNKHPDIKDADAIIVDVHAEATSEKMGMGQYLDGTVSLVVGTHTHVPTADTQVLGRGTAYQTDAGMCGDYDSVIGMNKDEPLRRFLNQLPKGRLAVASGEGTLCGVFVETGDDHKAVRAEPVRVGGRLREVVPTLNQIP